MKAAFEQSFRGVEPLLLVEMAERAGSDTLSSVRFSSQDLLAKASFCILSLLLQTLSARLASAESESIGDRLTCRFDIKEIATPVNRLEQHTVSSIRREWH
jgi:hypothetical protein